MRNTLTGNVMSAGVTTLLVAAAIVIPGAAWAAPIRLAAKPALQVTDVPGSVDYLTTTFGVTVDEALRRLELQRTAGELNDILTTEQRDNFAGSWIDQENGGLLLIASTSPAKLDPVLRALPDRAHIKVVKAAHTRNELQKVAAEVTSRLHLTEAQAAVVDDVSNQVVLHNKGATIAANAGGTGALGMPAGLVRIAASQGVRDPKACTIQNCTPPMRGGLKLYIFNSLTSRPNWIWSCTNGFNVHGSNGWQYTVTAGHCFEGAGNYADNDSHWVGYYQFSTLAGFFADYPADGMIAPYVVTGGVNYSSYWLNGQPANRVWDTRMSSLFSITGSYTYAQIGNGWVACHTGATSLNTRCGSVQTKDGGIVMNICTRGGDSGGPLFSEVDNRAYGVLSWGNNPADDCPAGVRSGYSPLSVLFSTVQGKTGLSFGVNT